MWANFIALLINMQDCTIFIIHTMNTYIFFKSTFRRKRDWYEKCIFIIVSCDFVKRTVALRYKLPWLLLFLVCIQFKVRLHHFGTNNATHHSCYRQGEGIGSCRGELLETLQEKREGLWEKWETEDSKLEGGWRPWRWCSGRPFPGSVGLGADCPAHRLHALSQAVSQESLSWVSGLDTITDSQHWQHGSGVSHNYYYWSWCDEKWVLMWCHPARA